VNAPPAGVTAYRGCNHSRKHCSPEDTYFQDNTLWYGPLRDTFVLYGFPLQDGCQSLHNLATTRHANIQLSLSTSDGTCTFLVTLVATCPAVVPRQCLQNLVLQPVIPAARRQHLIPID